MIAQWGAQALLLLARVLQALPLQVQAALGRGLGWLLWQLARSRRDIAMRNLALCLPELPQAERRAIAREHFALLGRSVVERGLLWHASAERLRRYIHVEGDVSLAERSDRPVMWLVPHFLGLDAAGTATQLYQTRPYCAIYAPASNPVFDRAVRRGRSRFGKTELFERQQGALPLVRAIKRGMVFANLPDMDFGPRDAAFVPFFGVPAATLLAPSRMARALDMTVQPVVAEILPGGAGCRVRFLEPWTDFPSDDAVADAARMNRWLEQEIRRMPAQYLWVHKRFKTRPPGEPPVY
jgi:Kdo2-lipid IVA lauroyltransferase/acyltransferase